LFDVFSDLGGTCSETGKLCDQRLIGRVDIIFPRLGRVARDLPISFSSRFTTDGKYGTLVDGFRLRTRFEL